MNTKRLLLNTFLLTGSLWFGLGAWTQWNQPPVKAQGPSSGLQAPHYTAVCDTNGDIAIIDTRTGELSQRLINSRRP